MEVKIFAILGEVKPNREKYKRLEHGGGESYHKGISYGFAS